MAKSEYFETLEKLQNALTQFDMSFGVSNRIFRLAIVSEIIDTACLFEQLYESWCECLPFGEGPDADVDFAYWKELSSWETLLNSAKQNACIDDFPFDMGNGLTSDRMPPNRRKTYLKTVNSVLRHSKYAGKETMSDFVKTINNDKAHMMTFGNMVFDALSSLLLVFSKKEKHLANPPQNLFPEYYVMQKKRFSDEINLAMQKTKEIMRESIPEKRKINKLKEMRDTIVKALRESGFLNNLKKSYTHYDVEDYRKEHNCQNVSDDVVLERLVINDLLTDDMQYDRGVIARYIYEYRKMLSQEAISSFYIFAEIIPEIERLLNVLKDCENKCDMNKDNIVTGLADSKQGDNGMSVQNFTIMGDLVFQKHVGNEVCNVESGATGIKVNKDDK